jgi:multidrug efflux pump subunit AcrA (membrane-fusion protein)
MALAKRFLPILFVVLLLAAVGCGPKPAAATPADAASEPVPVTVEGLKPRTVQRTVTSVGTLGGFDEATLAPKVDGRILTMNFDVGDPVCPGAVLLVLDSSDYKLQVNEAKRAFDAELARLGWTDLPAGVPDVDTVPSVRKTAVGIEDAKRKLTQKEDLHKKGAASDDELEIARTEFKLAEATHKQSVTEAQAGIASARWRLAALESAKQKLVDCEMRVPVPAPYPAWAAVVGAGFTPARYVVAQRLVTEGEMVRAMPVTNAYKVIVDFALKLRVQVPERFSAEVKLDQLVDVRVDAYPDRVFVGRVSRISPMVDSSTRSFGVEIVVPNAAGTLKAGGFARAAIRTRTDSSVLAVPPAAVVSFAGVTKVFVDRNGIAKAIPVSVGMREKDWVEVIGDLKPGDRVLTSGFALVVDGSTIRIRD